jgi:hypothetical protein
VVLEGTPLMLPTAQAMSDVGKRVKSAVEQEEELTDGAVDVEVRDISVVVTFSRGVVRLGRSRMRRVMYVLVMCCQANSDRV